MTEERLRTYRDDITVFLEEQYLLEDGNPIVLEPFQKEILRDVFQTKGSDGLRRYNLALLGIPKKNGKSTIASGVALYMLFADVPNAEVYSVAGDKDQAKIIFQMTKRAIERNPMLLSSVRIYKDEIVVPSTGSVYRVLSADAPTAHGLNPSCVIFDELWNQPNRDLYDALTQSPARKEPLTFVVTYAGTDQTSLLYELYRAGAEGKDPRMYFFWTEENLAGWVTEAYLCQQRTRLPAAVYQRLHENRWVQGENAFLTRSELDVCVDPLLHPQLSGRPGIRYFLAVDLGLTRDRTVLTVCHRDEKTDLVVVDRIRTFLGTRKNPVLIGDVEEEILSCNGNFDIAINVFDPWQMKSTAERLKRSIRVEEFSFTSSSVQKLSQNLYYLFHNGLIRMFPHPMLEEELLGLNAEERSYGWRIDHRSGGYSDHAISLGMAAMYTVREDVRSGGFLFAENEKRVGLEVKHGGGFAPVGSERRPNAPSFPTLRELESWRRRK